MKTKITTVALLSLVALTACGTTPPTTSTTVTTTPSTTTTVTPVSTSTDSTTPTTTSTSTPATTSTTPSTAQVPVVVKDLCQVMPASDVSAILGYEVTISDRKGPTSPTLTSCNYDSVDTSKGYGVSVRANYDNDYQSAKEAYIEAVDNQKTNAATTVKVSDLSGVGEEAILVDNPAIGTVIAVNKNIWVTLSLYGKGDARNQALEKIANKAFTVL